MERVDLSRSVNPWWSRLLASGEFAFDVVVGARQAGKSTFFSELGASRSDVVYWSIFEARRARDVDQAWRTFFEALGAKTSDESVRDPEQALDRFLSTNGPTTLVVDNWDDAVRANGGAVGDAYYEMLDELWGYCRAQTGSPSPKLGLVLVTSLPAASDLDWFSRQTQRPAFRRLSGAVARQMRAARFPFLTREDSIAVLCANGYDRLDAELVADQVGGWLWLLTKAIDIRAGAPGSPKDVLEAMAQVEVPRLLSAALLPALSERPEHNHLREQPLSVLTTALQGDRRPDEFGLPCDYKDGTALAPVLRLALRRTFVVVDTENVRVPFSRWAQVHPDQVAGDVHDYIRPFVSTWITRTAEEVGAEPHEIWLCGKNQQVIDQIVDVTLDDALRIDVPRTMRGKGGADDTLMGMYLVQQATRFPSATFVLLSGDQDLPLLLDKLGFDGQRLAVHAPWAIGGKLLSKASDFASLRAQTLGLGPPPQVSEGQMRAARHSGRRPMPGTPQRAVPEPPT